MSEWKERMALLRPWLSKFKRRFSALDLGCGDGDVSRAIAEEFDVVLVAVDKGLNESEAASTQRYESVPRSICLKYALTPDDLVSLADCEHFDVVLALNFLHHFRSAWSSATDAVLRMGWHVFVQLPSVGQHGVAGRDILPTLTDTVQTRNATLLGKAPHVSWERHLPRPLWLVQNDAIKSLPRPSMYGDRGPTQVPIERVTRVKATYDNIEHQRPDKDAGAWRKWIVGMNLWNVISLGCVHPTRGRIAEQVRAFSLPDEPHGDVIPWNFIYDSEVLHLIDPARPVRRDDRSGLTEVAREVMMEEPRRP